MADPGFPVGGGGVDLRRGRFSVKMYTKTKELGPMGGGGMCPAAPPPDPPMILTKNAFETLIQDPHVYYHLVR